LRREALGEIDNNKNKEESPGRKKKEMGEIKKRQSKEGGELSDYGRLGGRNPQGRREETLRK